MTPGTVRIMALAGCAWKQPSRVATPPPTPSHPQGACSLCSVMRGVLTPQRPRPMGGHHHSQQLPGSCSSPHLCEAAGGSTGIGVAGLRAGGQQCFQNGGPSAPSQQLHVACINQGAGRPLLWRGMAWRGVGWQPRLAACASNWSLGCGRGPSIAWPPTLTQPRPRGPLLASSAGSLACKKGLPVPLQQLEGRRGCQPCLCHQPAWQAEVGVRGVVCGQY